MQKKVVVSFVILLIFGFSLLLPSAYGISVSISTDKQTYHYGDFLTFTIKVSEITKDVAFLYISDEMGKQSSPIPFPISQLKSTETFPFPFDKEVYPEGKWKFEITYAGDNASTEFYLKDSGQIVIPVWIKDVTKMWTDDLITVEQYSNAIEYLIEQKIIIIPQMESQTDTSSEIPEWVKTNAKWWSDGMITDTDFTSGLQYLIKVGVIKVGNNDQV